MSTRSDIIAQLDNGKWARIYCHWDGYPDHNGKILAKHYTDPTKIAALIGLGDLSSLGEEIGEKHDFDYRGKRYHGKPGYSLEPGDPEWEEFSRLSRMCDAYGRDRGETGTEAEKFDNLAAAWPDSNTGTEYTYVWRDGVWFIGDPDEGSETLVPLADVLAGKVEIHSAIKAFGGNFVIGRH